jgi:hypothetical protein
VFQQFENLYPVMKRFVRLGDYDSVCENQRDLVYAFGLPNADPNYMPVTRDLSPAKQRVILNWLTTPGPDGKPLRGTPPAPSAAAPVTPAAAGPEPPTLAPEPPVGPRQGGKAAAASQRLAMARPRAIPAGTTVGGLEE